MVQTAIISYDSPRGGVSVITEKGDTTTSFLLIQSARPSDSGQYTCNPSNAKSKSVTVHVLNGEFPAAMQRAGQPHHRTPQHHQLSVLLSVFISSLLCCRLLAACAGLGMPVPTHCYYCYCEPLLPCPHGGSTIITIITTTTKKTTTIGPDDPIPFCPGGHPLSPQR
ncbi:conserved hypothetical protein [Culex quinquefasciatus]|uniref:Ig-like domain-containing protein n=1 Tax=Culex quinquefasciatus TaxID=7176 RepID=B0X6L3_CULQU|nr:conserved hypothetical protein [Culex quinquefasciatus]|eukprot:XP_001865285.1 conserved hypothetical protein [Culex quinquefasciatus]